MTVEEVLRELEGYGDERTKSTLIKHGAREPFFGVKVADLKKILKKTKKDHQLSLALYETGNTDAMYLAGLMADENLISKEDLQHWVEQAYWSYLSEYTVPWVASETPFGFELGLKWIDSDVEGIAAAGWSTLASYAAVNPDENLDIPAYAHLLERAVKDIGPAQNRVRYAINGFVIAIGSYISDLTPKAISAAESIGVVEVEMNGTACKVLLTTSKRLSTKTGWVKNARQPDADHEVVRIR